MIGVKADQSELAGTSPYKLYDRLASGMLASISLGMEEARARWWYIPASQKSFCAEFSRKEISTHLSAKDCEGIQLVPKMLATGYWPCKCRR